MLSTLTGWVAKAGWAPTETCEMTTGKCHQIPALKMTHVWPKHVGSLCSGFCSETCCKQGIDNYNHCWKFLCFVSPWQFLAIWHHPNVLPLLSLHSALKHFAGLVAEPCSPGAAPSFLGTVVSSAASILHPITSLKAVRKKEIRKERNKGKKYIIKIYVLDFYSDNWGTGWSSAEIGIDL